MPQLLDRAVWRRFQVRLLRLLSILNKFKHVSSLKKLPHASIFHLGMPREPSADKLHGLSYAEMEDFLADVARRYVLSLPGADSKKIVAERLAQWQKRFSLQPSE